MWIVDEPWVLKLVSFLFDSIRSISIRKEKDVKHISCSFVLPLATTALTCASTDTFHPARLIDVYSPARLLNRRENAKERATQGPMYHCTEVKHDEETPKEVARVGEKEPERRAGWQTRQSRRGRSEVNLENRTRARIRTEWMGAVTTEVLPVGNRRESKDQRYSQCDPRPRLPHCLGRPDPRKNHLNSFLFFALMVVHSMLCCLPRFLWSSRVDPASPLFRASLYPCASLG